MAGICSSDAADLNLAKVPVVKVTSGTRFNWSRAEVGIFESFVRDKHLTTKCRSQGSFASLDIESLLVDLNLGRFLSMKNGEGDQLRPIIETKVRRKLAAVAADLKAIDLTKATMLPGPEKTRLQATRARAIAAGQKPPARLPQPDPVYTPEVWKPKNKPKPSSGNTTRGAGTGLQPAAASAVPSTVEEAQEQVHRLEKALESARRRLSQLQKEQQEQQEQQKEDGMPSGSGSGSARHGADMELSIKDDMGPQGQAIGLVSDPDPDPDSNPDLDSKSTDSNSHVHVAPIRSHRATSSPLRASPSGPITPKTVDPTSREALLTLVRDDSRAVLPKHRTDTVGTSTKPDEPVRTLHQRRLPRNRTLASLVGGGNSDEGVDEDEDDSDHELNKRLEKIGEYLNAKYGKAG